MVLWRQLNTSITLQAYGTVAAVEYNYYTTGLRYCGGS